MVTIFDYSYEELFRMIKYQKQQINDLQNQVTELDRQHKAELKLRVEGDQLVENLDNKLHNLRKELTMLRTTRL
jgi:predicted RNase H-like nuclease (RuvC/YqgF family)